MSVVIVRRLEKKDLLKRTQWYNNEIIYSQVLLDIPFSLTKTKKWYNSIIDDPTRKDFSFDISNSEKEPNLMAMGGLVNIDRQHQRAERYFLLDPVLIGRGYGIKMLTWITNYGFIALNLNRIFGLSLSNNKKVLKVNSKEGWTHEGTMRKSVYYNGKYYDQHIKSILREDWNKMSWKLNSLSFKIEL